MKGKLMSENNGEHTTGNDGAPQHTPPASEQAAVQQPTEAPASGNAEAVASPTVPPAPTERPRASYPARPWQTQQDAAASTDQGQNAHDDSQHLGYPAAPAAGAYGTPHAAPTAATPSYSAAEQRGSASSENPTERIPGNFAAENQPDQQGQQSQYGQPAQHYGASGHPEPSHAGPGYPAANAYPHTLAPAVMAKSKERKKVGMGLFSASILAAALVGGLVAGGTSFLLDGQGNNTVAGSSQQSSPLVVNNPKSVNEVSAAAAKAMPSVVTISATSGNSGGTGSGIILDAEGHILTNTHVVTLDGAAAHADIEVQLSDNKVYKATIVGTDPLSDLAVVKIDAPNLVPAELGQSSKINVGDTVIAIGSPLGLNGTVTDGIVSTLNRTIQVASSAVPETPSDSSPDQSDGGNGFRFSPPGGEQDTQAAQGTVNLNVIQTDAAINPGNSGGALVNGNGQIVGVNVAIASAGSSSGASSQSGNIGVGFSIPIDHAQQVAQQIIETGKATHGQLGVSVSGTSATGSSGAFSSGATVKDVTADSAAAKAGLQNGDVITRLGERTISDPADLTAAVREQPGGATVKLDFTRDGKAQSVDVTLDTMTAS